MAHNTMKTPGGMGEEDARPTNASLLREAKYEVIRTLLSNMPAGMFDTDIRNMSDEPLRRALIAIADITASDLPDVSRVKGAQLLYTQFCGLCVAEDMLVADANGMLIRSVRDNTPHVESYARDAVSEAFMALALKEMFKDLCNGPAEAFFPGEEESISLLRKRRSAPIADFRLGEAENRFPWEEESC